MFSGAHQFKTQQILPNVRGSYERCPDSDGSFCLTRECPWPLFGLKGTQKHQHLGDPSLTNIPRWFSVSGPVGPSIAPWPMFSPGFTFHAKAGFRKENVWRAPNYVRKRPPVHDHDRRIGFPPLLRIRQNLTRAVQSLTLANMTS